MVTPNEGRITDHSIIDELKDSYLNYAMSVIVSRALPDVRDGLKPSQRRILVAMNDLNLGPRSKHRKCAKIVGDTSGNYHPHGDQATYGTLVRMGQHWNMRTMLVDKQGNFGSVDDDPPAAMRYTEARMHSAAADMMIDINRDTVNFSPNYDETTTEPSVLPAKFPNLVVNGCTGIAVGMATNMAPHNPGEVCETLIKLLDNPELTIKEILDIMPGPDFPGGSTICGRSGIVDAYTTGRGSIPVRAKIHTETSSKGRTSIIVDEIPFQTVKSSIVIKIANCVNTGVIDGISDVRDESDRKGMRIVVVLKKDADDGVIINQLYKYTQLQSNFSVNNIALVKNRPQTLNMKQMLSYFLDHRKEVIRRRTQFLLRKALTRAHIVEGLILAQSDIDEIIRLIRQSSDVATAREALMNKSLRLMEHATLKKLLPDKFVEDKTNNDQFLTGPQADAILAMQLQRLTGLEIEKLGKEYAALSSEIDGYESILTHENLLFDIIREDLHEMKAKYNSPRRSEIEGAVGDFNMEELVPEEEAIVTISHDGYIKRAPTDTFRKQGRGGKGVKGSSNKENDFIEHLFTASTHDYLCFFTDLGRCYWLRVYDLPEMSRTSRGRNVANLIEMQAGENIAQILPVSVFDDRMLLMATKYGAIKKTLLSAYGNVRKNGINAITLMPGDALIGAAISSGDNEIILGTRNGLAIRFSEETVRPCGRTARGVKGIGLRPNDEVVDLLVVDGTASSLLTICELGLGKISELKNYRVQGRAGKGLINVKITPKNGRVVALKMVNKGLDLMIITAKGVVIRTGLDQVRSTGRNSIGVKMMNLDGGDHIVAVAPVLKEEILDSDENSDENSD